MQETPFSSAADPPAGTGTGRITHDEPFQTSENRPLLSLPTARQASAVGQATAFSTPPPADGAGIRLDLPGRAVPALGQQGRACGALRRTQPIAVHAVVPEHATAASSLIVAPAGTGGLACVQALPFQRSATGTKSLPESRCCRPPRTTARCGTARLTGRASSGCGTVRTVQRDPFQVSANWPKPCACNRDCDRQAGRGRRARHGAKGLVGRPGRLRRRLHLPRRRLAAAAFPATGLAPATGPEANTPASPATAASAPTAATSVSRPDTVRLIFIIHPRMMSGCYLTTNWIIHVNANSRISRRSSGRVAPLYKDRRQL